MAIRKRVDFHKIHLAELNPEYRYVDMHTHTKYSFDSNALISNIAKKMRKYHYGIAVTDHDTIGGVKALMRPQFRDLFIIPGIEVRCDRGWHTLLYFYNVDELYEYYQKYIGPRFKALNILSAEEQLYAAEDYNCVKIMAHPFAPGSTAIRCSAHEKFVSSQLFRKYDGVEVIQGCNLRARNFKAVDFAQQLNCMITGGSDAHTTSGHGHTLTYTKEIATVSDFLDTIRKKKNFVMGEGRANFKNTMEHLGKIPGIVGNTPYYLSIARKRLRDLHEARQFERRKKRAFT